ncbi:hypothetical protein SCHPADRAFT_612078 [Schizopora paradoxa]|uniref:Uncharacterized protein n=1 Tax=Schizopora paradoxa TaxID=27342 RepID=A0A0H2RU23_9AGAM|nr:hypothetical protein SCHPADRAFT_612078 [Schizopora paradoxa]
MFKDLIFVRDYETPKYRRPIDKFLLPGVSCCRPPLPPQTSSPDKARSLHHDYRRCILSRNLLLSTAYKGGTMDANSTHLKFNPALNSKTFILSAIYLNSKCQIAQRPLPRTLMLILVLSARFDTMNKLFISSFLLALLFKSSLVVAADVAAPVAAPQQTGPSLVDGIGNAINNFIESGDRVL